MRPHLWSLIALVLLTITGFLYFPGHTYLQADTQIYVPIMERLNDPSLFNKEIIAQRPHVSFTIYDEVTIGLRKLTGFGFRYTLEMQQIVFRFCGLVGVYLIALSLQLSPAASVMAAAIFGLGATIMGPSVLTIEYEPVPRANAIGLTLLAIGLLAHGRNRWAAVAAGLAFLYHVPAIYPYWIVFLALAFFPRESKQHWQGLAIMAASVACLLILSKLQVGETDKQSFFSIIDPDQEKMMRMRVSYVWVSLWSASFYWHYLILWTLTLFAIWRLKDNLSFELKWMALGTSTIGMLSMPVSYLLLEQMKWGLIPQIQPMRALLYVTAFFIIMTACAGLLAAQKKQWAEAGGWLFLALLPSTRIRSIDSVLDTALVEAALAAILASALIVAAFFLGQRLPLAVAAAAFMLAFIIPGVSKVRNYGPLHSPQLDQLSAWARTNTDKETVFLFPEAGRDLAPGVFRAESLRTVYVDWKGGGQINFLREFLVTWLPRWQQALEPKFQPEFLTRYKQWGIDYIVLPLKTSLPGHTPIFQNSSYAAYHIE